MRLMLILISAIVFSRLSYTQTIAYVNNTKNYLSISALIPLSNGRIYKQYLVDLDPGKTVKNGIRLGDIEVAILGAPQSAQIIKKEDIFNKEEKCNRAVLVTFSPAQKPWWQFGGPTFNITLGCEREKQR